MFNFIPDKDRVPEDPNYLLDPLTVCKGIRIDLEVLLQLTTEFNYSQLETAYNEAKVRFSGNEDYLQMVEDLYLELKTNYFDYTAKEKSVRVSKTNPPLFWKEGDCAAIRLPGVDDRIYSVRYNPQLTLDDDKYVLKEYQSSGVYTFDTLYYYTEVELLANGATLYE